MVHDDSDSGNLLAAGGSLAIMEMREIEIFLVLADELHFGRTAERLLLSQARVSQTIQTLERRTGVRLFERTSRRVALTPQGKALRDRLLPAYEEIQRALDDTNGIVGELRISALSLLSPGPSYDAIVGDFEARHPGCKVTLSIETTLRGLERLRRREIDIVATFLPVDAPDLVIGPRLTRRDRILLVASDHPLAAKGSAEFEDLADHPSVEGRDILPPETMDACIPPRTPSGRVVHRQFPTSNTDEALALVASGVAVKATTMAFLDYYRHPQVVAIPLEGLPPLESGLVWVADNETAAIRAFADAARRYEEGT